MIARGYGLDGLPDPAVTDYVNIAVYSTGILVNGAGKVAALGRTPPSVGTGWQVVWLDGTGHLDTSVNANGSSSDATPDTLLAGTYDRDSLYAIGSGDVVFRLLCAGGGYDASFGANGRVSFPGSAGLNSARIDSKGRLIVGGLGGAGAFVGRVARGQLDKSFATQGYTSYGPNVTSGGTITLGPDDKVLQLANLTDGAGNHCAVVRRLEDGTLDPSFGQAGVATLPVLDCGATDLTTTSDGKLLLGGPKTLRIWL